MAYDVEMPDPVSKSGSKILESVVFDADLGGHVVVHDQAIPHRTVRPLSAFETANVLTKEQISYPGTLIDVSVQNPGNSNEVRVRKRYYPKNGEDTVYPSKTARKVDRGVLSQFADTYSVQKTLVGRQTALGTVDPLTISVDQDLYSPDLDTRVLVKADAFQTREDVETDPDTGLMTKIVREVVYALPTLSEQAAGKNVTFKEVASGVWIKETRTALKSDGTEVNPADNAAFYTFIWETYDEFDFPSYQLPLTSSLFPRVFLANQRRTMCAFKLPIRLGFRGLTRTRYTETLHAAPPTLPSVVDLTGRNWTQEGMLVSFNVNNVLCDDPNAAFYDLATLPGDTFHGNYTERIASQAMTVTTGTTYHLSYLNVGQPVPTYRNVRVRVSRGPNKTYRMLLTEVYLK